MKTLHLIVEVPDNAAEADVVAVVDAELACEFGLEVAVRWTEVSVEMWEAPDENIFLDW